MCMQKCLFCNRLKSAATSFLPPRIYKTVFAGLHLPSTCVQSHKGMFVWIISSRLCIAHWNPCWIQFRILTFLAGVSLCLKICQEKWIKRQERHKGGNLVAYHCIPFGSKSEEKLRNKTKSTRFLHSPFRTSFCKREIFNLLQSTDCMISCNRLRLICILSFVVRVQ